MKRKKYITKRSDIITLVSNIGKEPSLTTIEKYRGDVWKVKQLKPVQFQKIEMADPELAQALYAIQKMKQTPEFSPYFPSISLSDSDYAALSEFKFPEPLTEQAKERTKKLTNYQAYKLVESNEKSAKRRARVDLQVLLEGIERINKALSLGAQLDERGKNAFEKWVEDKGGVAEIRKQITKANPAQLGGILYKLNYFRRLKTINVTGATISYVNWQVKTRGFLSGKSPEYRRKFWALLEDVKQIDLKYYQSEYWDELTTILDDATVLKEVDALIEEKTKMSITEKMYSDSLEVILRKNQKNRGWW